jgi:hypothetical protein
MRQGNERIMSTASGWVVRGLIGAIAMLLGVSTSLAGGLEADSMTAPQASAAQMPVAPSKPDKQNDRPAEGWWQKLPPMPPVPHPSPEDAEMLE